MLQIDEKNIDGKEILDYEFTLLDMNSKLSERNKRLIEIAAKALNKGKGVIDLDNLSLDSDELITT